MGEKIMKFLVLGCNGMAGHLISIYLQEQGHDIVGFARKESPFVKTIVGDAKDIDSVKKVIEEGQFGAVINAIGLLNQFAENDREAAVFLNAYLPHYIAKITENSKTQIIHMSTDCVFSGKRGGYTEADFPDGTSFYDRTKAMGELDDGKNITLRNSIIGPDINPAGIGLLNWFLQQHEMVKGYRKAIWTGQTTLQLAKTIEKIVLQRAHGLYNMVPKSKISKYEMLVLFNKYIRSDPIEIIEDESLVVDKSLVRTNFDGFSYTIPDYAQQIEELGTWMRQHKEIYPHYML